MLVALLGVAGRSAAVGVLRQPASEVAAGAFVLALDVSLVPAVDGRVQDRLLHRGLAAVDRCDGVADDYFERGVVGRGKRRGRHWRVGHALSLGGNVPSLSGIGVLGQLAGPGQAVDAEADCGRTKPKLVGEGVDRRLGCFS